MTRVYECTFRIRHHECDAGGQVNHANFLRYMQEAAYLASADAGYDMVGYRALGTYWYIRETELEILQQLDYGDRVRVRTWVEDFHRVRSIRGYELWSVETGALCAKGWSDWVYLVSATGMPTTIPGEMIDTFIPDEKERKAYPRRRFPAAPVTPWGYYSQQRRVEWRDLDAMQHINNAVYSSFFEDCALQASKKYNWTVERIRQAGFKLVARKARIEYRQAAFLDDPLEIETWISELDSSSMKRHFNVWRVENRDLLCQANIEYFGADLSSGETIDLPVQLVQDLSAAVAEAADE